MVELYFHSEGFKDQSGKIIRGSITLGIDNLKSLSLMDLMRSELESDGGLEIRLNINQGINPFNIKS